MWKLLKLAKQVDKIKTYMDAFNVDIELIHKKLDKIIARQKS